MSAALLSRTEVQNRHIGRLPGDSKISEFCTHMHVVELQRSVQQLLRQINQNLVYTNLISAFDEASCSPQTQSCDTTRTICCSFNELQDGHTSALRLISFTFQAHAFHQLQSAPTLKRLIEAQQLEISRLIKVEVCPKSQ